MRTLAHGARAQHAHKHARTHARARARAHTHTHARAQDEAARRELESLPARAFVNPADAARLAPPGRIPDAPGAAAGSRCGRAEPEKLCL